MILNDKEINKLLKFTNKFVDEKLESFKFLSNGVIESELKNIQIDFQHQNFTLFADLVDDVIFKNVENYSENYLSENHIVNIENLAKLVFENYISKLKFLKNNTSLILDNEKNIFENVEKLKLMKEKEYLTSEEVSELYQIKKDKLLEIRTKKLLKYFQLEDNGKVLFAKKDVEEFMKTYTF
ncbi:helix-turn-helix domain-containing protein [Aliarcobacter butzleri]|uniref:helix-turn-helix domain-containing protein n=1 Tax=Aliarcobacter butzleri TaxID=28197 RepID=UPI0021B224E7|nr:helix-turn-helix domain-containing protein [Aliarcobacter butzleri]MCT7581747.1 helix-turn-helix domain-containing protein [Aliarcobacter butzleri]